MTDTKKRHSAAFKARVALEVAKQTRTLAELSGTFQVHSVQISKWKKQLLDGGTEQEFSSSYEHMEGDTTARPIGRTEPVSIVWREPPRMSVSLSRSSKFANKSSLSMSPSPRAH